VLSLRFHFGLLAIGLIVGAATPTSDASTLQIQLRTKPPTFCGSTNYLPLVKIPPGEIKPIYHRNPQYPPEAISKKIEGTVRLEACIAPEGEVTGLLVISGHPLLLKAAMEAASHWRFAPVRWRGEPAQALTEIDVPFRLKSEGPQKNRPANET